ncbi:transcription factor 21-like [Oppia nitens]|uniref:transcription factor 21-like n=1 Tax=Oppia nitens TaxID=1686743 RepID=UPI0023DBD0B7|nr:transcription factor 21-like [Oppia nitens]
MYSFDMTSTANIENSNSTNFNVNTNVMSFSRRCTDNRQECDDLNGVPTTPVPYGIYMGSSPTGAQTMMSPSSIVSNCEAHQQMRQTSLRKTQSYKARHGSSAGALNEDNSTNGNTSTPMAHLTREERRRRRRATQKYRLAHATRERIRVEAFNVAFSHLRHLLPTLPPDKKLSKIEILRLAICYIAYLNHVLDA